VSSCTECPAAPAAADLHDLEELLDLLRESHGTALAALSARVLALEKETIGLGRENMRLAGAIGQLRHECGGGR